MASNSVAATGPSCRPAATLRVPRNGSTCQKPVILPARQARAVLTYSTWLQLVAPDRDSTLQALHSEAQGKLGAPPWVPERQKPRTLQAFHSQSTDTLWVTRQWGRRYRSTEWNACSVRETSACSPMVGLRGLRPRRPTMGFGMQRLQRCDRIQVTVSGLTHTGPTEGLPIPNHGIGDLRSGAWGGRETPHNKVCPITRCAP